MQTFKKSFWLNRRYRRACRFHAPRPGSAPSGLAEYRSIDPATRLALRHPFPW